MKKGYLLLAVICCTLLGFIPKVYGQDDSPGVIVFPSVSFLQEGGTLAGDQNVLSIDMRAGYRISSGWYFGMIYNNTSSGGTNTLNGSAIGNSVGYFDGIFSVIASYYLSGEMSENTPSSYVQRSNGSGFQLDVALNFTIATDLYIGPMLTYKVMNYSAETFSGSTEMNASQTQSFVYPFIGMYYRF